MSDDPRSQIPLRPLPVDPVPVIPVPAFPVHRSVSFSSSYNRSARPAILTALGIASIIIASLGIIGNGVSAIGSLIASQSANIMKSFSAPRPMPSNPTPGQTVSGDGLSPQQRKVVVETLNNLRPLSEARVKQLDDLLADQGKKIILLSDDAFTPDRITSYVTDVKEMPTGNDVPDDVFILGSGRLQISDRTAVFFPTGSFSGIHAGDNSPQDVPANVSPGGNALTQEQIDAVEAKIRDLAEHGMNDAQKQTLGSALAYQNQNIIFGGNSPQQAADGVQEAHVTVDGTLYVTTPTSKLTITPDGTGTMEMNLPPPSTFGNGAGPKWLMADSLTSGALGIYLLVCGILLLRNIHAVRWLHLIYAGLRLLLAALMVIGLGISTQWSAPAIAFRMAAGLVYPVVVIIVLLQKSVREFYSAPVIGR